MSVTGTCQICEQQSADEQCERCGALVCGRHYDPAHDVCTQCAAEMGLDEGSGSGQSDRNPDTGHRL